MTAFLICAAFFIGLAIDQRGPVDVVTSARRFEFAAGVACACIALALYALGHR